MPRVYPPKDAPTRAIQPHLDIGSSARIHVEDDRIVVEADEDVNDGGDQAQETGHRREYDGEVRVTRHPLINGQRSSPARYDSRYESPSRYARGDVPVRRIRLNDRSVSPINAPIYVDESMRGQYPAGAHVTRRTLADASYNRGAEEVIVVADSDLEQENRELRAALEALSAKFQAQFDAATKQRDDDYMELQGKYKAVVQELKDFKGYGGELGPPGSLQSKYNIRTREVAELSKRPTVEHHRELLLKFKDAEKELEMYRTRPALEDYKELHSKYKKCMKDLGLKIKRDKYVDGDKYISTAGSPGGPGGSTDGEGGLYRSASGRSITNSMYEAGGGLYRTASGRSVTTSTGGEGSSPATVGSHYSYLSTSSPGLRFYVKEATDLASRPNACPTVRIVMNGATEDTRAHEPSIHPVWHEYLILPDNSTRKRRIQVIVLDVDKEIGAAQLELPAGHLEVDIWVPVSKNNEIVGQVHLGVETQDQGARWPTKPAPAKPKPKMELAPPTGKEWPIPTPNRGQHWDLSKMDGEKFWVCLVAQDGLLVLDPAEFRKAPHKWAMSQESTEAIFNAYPGSFQSSMRRRGLNKLSTYWQKEINDMKGIYLSHLDDHVGGPKAVALKAKEEQILALEKKLEELEASREDLAGELVESSTLLKDKAFQIDELNRAMNDELNAIVRANKRIEVQRNVNQEDVDQVARDVEGALRSPPSMSRVTIAESGADEGKEQPKEA